MHFYLRIASALFLLLSAACATDDQKAELIGSWKGESWTVNGQASDRSAEDVRFEFKADDTYTAAYGSQREAGSFRVKDDHLYTTAEDKIEKMVRFSIIHQDTLVMNMNRVGTAEKLALIRAK